MFIGSWDLDQSLSWCLKSGFNQCCNLLAPVAVFGSGTGQLWLHWDWSSEHMPNACPRKNDLVPLMPFLLFSFPLSLLLFIKLLLTVIITCRHAPTSIFKQIKDKARGKQELGRVLFCPVRIHLLSAFDFQLFVWPWIFKKYGKLRTPGKMMDMSVSEM